MSVIRSCGRSICLVLGLTVSLVAVSLRAEDVLSKAELAARQKIDAKLDRVAELNMKNTPLKEIPAILREKQIPIVMDEEAVENSGVQLNLPFSLSFTGLVSYRAVIGLIFEQLGLTYVVGPEQITITSQTAAEKLLETREYDLKPLLALSKEGEKLAPLIGVMTDGPWEQTDGAGGTIEAKPNTITIRQHQPGHRQIENMLHQIQRALAPRVPPTREEAAEANWTELLNKPIDIEFTDLQLLRVCQTVGEKNRLFFWTNGRAMSLESIDEMSLCTGSFKKTPVKKMMETVLDPLKLTYVMDHEVILVTTKKAAAKSFLIRAYALARVPKGKDPAAVIEGLHEVEDVTWEDRDRTGGRVGFLGPVLIVRQSAPAFEKIGPTLGEKPKPVVKTR